MIYTPNVRMGEPSDLAKFIGSESRNLTDQLIIYAEIWVPVAQTIVIFDAQPKRRREQPGAGPC